MSPTVFREGSYRFYFNSREEDRLHVHIEAPSGELKIWLEPRIEEGEKGGRSPLGSQRSSCSRRQLIQESVRGGSSVLGLESEVEI